MQLLLWSPKTLKRVKRDRALKKAIRAQKQHLLRIKTCKELRVMVLRSRGVL